MSERLPASLAYLLIYNPTLEPPANTSQDDEDAEEEAHIMFYTSRDRVTSRDRMLRQVGLAKALVNFAQIFTTTEKCDNVHSQGRRLVSLSPEPNFWMHACIDIARTPTQRKDKTGGTTSTYHYHNESVDDGVIRSQLLRGYEAFKLLYGSFTSILDSGGGTPALQMRLEHFFTPWAWKWDLEDDPGTQAIFGLHLHPASSSLSPLLANLCDSLPLNSTVILLCRPYIISFPSSPIFQLPQSLPEYLWSIVPDPQDRPILPRVRSKGFIKNSDDHSTVKNANSNSTLSGTLNFFSNGLGDVVNIKKWNWSTPFGNGKEETTPLPSANVTETQAESGLKNDLAAIAPEGPSSDQEISDVCATVDHAALDDAISSPNPYTTNVKFSRFTAYLSEPTRPLDTYSRRILYLSFHTLILAIVADPERLEDMSDDQLTGLASVTLSCLRKIRELINSETETKPHASAGQSAYMICDNEQIVSSQGAIQKPPFSYLLNIKETMFRNPHMKEIFSRPTQPHTWLTARSGFGSARATGDNTSGVYLQMAREGASLVDVDNEVESAMKRSMTGGSSS